MTGITLRYADRSKLGGDEGSGTDLSGGSFEDARDINLEDRSEDIEDSELGNYLGSGGGSEIGFSDDIFEGK